MNTINLFNTNLSKTYEGLTAVIYKEDDLINVPYSDVSDTEKYYFTRDATFIFRFPRGFFRSFPSKAFRYLFKPDLAYSLAGSNTKYYFKIGLLYVTLIIMLVWIFLTAKYFRRRRISLRSLPNVE